MRLTMTSMGLLLASATAVVAACVGDDPEPTASLEDGGGSDSSVGTDGSTNPSAIVVTDIYRGGSRLEPNYITLADGQKQFVDWWDTTLKAHCRYRRLADGKTRCVPLGEAAFTDEAIFADSTCSGVHAYRMAGGCSQIPAYVADGTCPPVIHRTGKKLAGSYEPSPPPCHVAQTDGLFFEQLDEVPPEQWQEGTIEDWDEAPDAGGLPNVKARFVRGADGSYGFYQWMLRAVATPCVFTAQPSETTYRCQPTHFAAGTGNFVDDTCTRPVVSGVGANCENEEQKLAATYERGGDACYPTVKASSWFLLGAPYSGYPFYKLPDGTCKAQTELQTVGFSAGQPFDLGELVIDATATTSPLAPVYGVLPDSTRTRLWFRDTAHDTRCELVRAADGKTRCLPIGGGGSIYGGFTDASCTAPLRVVRVAHPYVDKPPCSPGDPSCPKDCAAPPKPDYVRAQSGACAVDLKATVFRTGAPRTSFYEKSGASCVERTAKPGEAFYDAAELPATDFAEGTPSYL